MRPNPSKTSDFSGIQSFVEAIEALRNPKTGCPWDLKQDHQSLTKYLLEEVHEFLESLQTQGHQSAETWEELGDVLLQIGLHCQIASEGGWGPNLNQLAAEAADKIRLRHPHVFDPNFKKFKTAEEVSEAWESIKAYGRQKKPKPNKAQTPENKDKNTKTFGDIPRGLPALLKAQRIGEKAASLGFDWAKPEEVYEKLHEELLEFIKASSGPQRQEETGDLLFAATQWIRKMNLDGEQLLSKAIEKFEGRFLKVLSLAHSENLDLKTLNSQDWERLWLRAKALTPTP